MQGVALSAQRKAFVCSNKQTRPTVSLRRPVNRSKAVTTMAFLGIEKSEDIKQAKQVQKGDKLDLDFEFLILDVGTEEPKTVKLGELIKGKKAVLFGLPGTNRCLLQGH